MDIFVIGFCCQNLLIIRRDFMRKVFTQVLSVIMVMFLAISLVGCKDSSVNNNADPTQAPVSSVAPTEKSVYHLTDEKITLNAFAVKSENVVEYETNEFTKWYEEQTNVHIIWDTVPMSDYGTKLDLVLAGGTYPDIFFGIGGMIQPNQEVKYGTDQKVFLPLNNFIDNNSVYFKKLVDNDPSIRSTLTQLDGNIYSLPHINECYHCSVQQKAWINQTWLDNLGLKMPTTTDEYYEVLKAFKNNDPNQNGLQDEIPLTGGFNTWRAEIYPFFVNAFIYYDYWNPYQVLNDGKIESVVNTNEFKNALTFLKKLYDEGLMAPEALTQTGNELWAEFNDSEVTTLGSFPAGAMNIIADMTKERHKEYVVMPPLKGPNGVQLTAYYPSTPSTGAFAISTSCKNPEIAFKWADGLFSEECTLRYVENGREGIEWRYAQPGELGLNGEQAKYAIIPGFSTAVSQNVHYSQVGPSVRTADWRASWATPQDMLKPEGTELRWYQESTKYMPYIPEIYAKKQYKPMLHFTSEQSSEISKLAAPISDYSHNSACQFIAGEMNLDNDWDTYVKTLDDMGIQKWMDILNAANEAADAAEK
jgi:putative aldouronate transport system substrate-binding protein